MRKRTKRILAALAAVVILGTAAFLTVENRSYWRRLLFICGEAAADGKGIELNIVSQPFMEDIRVWRAVYMPGEGIYAAVTTSADRVFSLAVAAGEATCAADTVSETHGLRRKLVEVVFPMELGPEPGQIFLQFWESGPDAQGEMTAILCAFATLEPL